jgi:hypothetical protein
MHAKPIYCQHACTPGIYAPRCGVRGIVVRKFGKGIVAYGTYTRGPVIGVENKYSGANHVHREAEQIQGIGVITGNPPKGMSGGMVASTRSGTTMVMSTKKRAANIFPVFMILELYIKRIWFF